MRLSFVVITILALSVPGFAASKKITGQVTAGSATKAIVLTAKGSKTTNVASNGKFSVTLPSGATNARIIFTKNSSVVGYLYAKKCVSVKSCSSSKLAASFKAGSTLPKAKFESTKGYFVVGAFKSQTLYKAAVVQSFVNSNAAASGKNLGMINLNGNSIQGGPRTLVDPILDSDGDGAPNLLDVDDDNDGITDNYDSSTPSAPAGESFRIFSNLKVELPNAVNVNTGVSSVSAIDNLMSTTTTLAVQVLEGAGESSELNCGSLEYCSAGGTGVTLSGSSPFPGNPGDANDTDGDGFGEISAGGTGDFQLRTGASSSEINAGDTIIQTVTGGSKVREVPGMLNFVFNTTPAIKTVQVNSDTAQTISYPVGNGDLGTSNNCFPVPDSGDVKVTLTAWRPQRPGLTGAGEAEYVDIGNSTIVVDIPNAPCSSVGGGGCSGNGPGTCGASTYSTTDSNLTPAGEGLLDTKGDTDASTSNTFTFTFDLDDCLTNRSIAWNSGEKVIVDLQMKDSVGDNAAVKVCFKRI